MEPRDNESLTGYFNQLPANRYNMNTHTHKESALTQLKNADT